MVCIAISGNRDFSIIFERNVHGIFIQTPFSKDFFLREHVRKFLQNVKNTQIAKILFFISSHPRLILNT